MNILLILSILCLIIALVLRYMIGRRRFNRRTPFGTEGFGSYHSMVGSRLLENFGTFASRLLFILAILFFVAYKFGTMMEEKARKEAIEMKEKKNR